jgi:hypothetical protein
MGKDGQRQISNNKPNDTTVPEYSTILNGRRQWMIRAADDHLNIQDLHATDLMLGCKRLVGCLPRLNAARRRGQAHRGFVTPLGNLFAVFLKRSVHFEWLRTVQLLHVGVLTPSKAPSEWPITFNHSHGRIFLPLAAAIPSGC